MSPTPAESLKIVAMIRVKPGKREEMIQAALAVIEPTRVEKGCQEYEFFSSVDDENLFTFVETWTSPAALDEHLQTPHIQSLFAKLESLVDGEPQIFKLKLIR